MLIVAFMALIALVVGCAGLGRLARPVVGLDEDSLRPASALLGVGLLLWLTLVLGTAGLFSTWSLLAAIAVGLALSAVALLGAARRSFPDPATGLALVVVSGAMLALIFIPPEINANDDGPAYLLFSEKLARLGASGPEPFSERRLYGFGAQFGLVALIRDLFGTRWLSLYEPGLGLALIGAWLLLIGHTSAMSRLVRLVLVFGVAFVWLTLTARPIANLAPAMLYAAVLFGAVEAWLRTHSDPDQGRGWFRLLAIFCALALTLRPTALPFIGLLAASAAIPVVRRRDWGELAIALALASVVLAPALVSSFQASQTAFYPFLGQGVHVGGSATVGAPLTETLATTARAGWSWLLLGLGGVVWLWLRRTGRAPTGGLVLLGFAGLAVGLIAVATGGLALDRYAFPVLFAVFAALCARLEISNETSARLGGLVWPALFGTGVAAVGVVALAVVPAGRSAVQQVAPAALHLRWRQPALDTAIGAAYREAQSRVPAGTTILAIHLVHADQLDVRRNTILAADQAATAGPAPGWPQTASPGVLAAYLRDAGVDYVAVADVLLDNLEGDQTAWHRRLRASRLLARDQITGATRTIRPVAEGPGFRIYSVAGMS